jgi:hypothetical protein
VEVADDTQKTPLWRNPAWIGAAAALLSAIVPIGIFLASRSESPSPSPTTTTITTGATTSTTEPPSSTTVAEDEEIEMDLADTRAARDDVVSLNVPPAWDQLRSYAAPFSYEETDVADIPTHTFTVSEDAENTGIEFYLDGGVAVSVSAEVERLGLDATSSTDDIAALLAENYKFNLDCNPEFSLRRVSPADFTGLIREWRGCGPENDRFGDGLLFADNGSAFVYVQLRPDVYDWESTVAVVLGSLSVDQAALARATDEPGGDRVVP